MAMASIGFYTHADVAVPGVPVHGLAAPLSGPVALPAAQDAWQDAARASAPSCARSAGVTAAALLAVGVAAKRRRGRGAKKTVRLAQVLGEQETQGSVEGVRVVKPGSDEALKRQELKECRKTTVVDGVMKLGFLVPRDKTGSSEEYEFGRGTSENSYVLYDQGGSPEAGPITIIDVPELRFMNAFFKEVTPYLPRLKNIVLTHVGEEDVEMVTMLAVDAEKAIGSKPKVYCSGPAKNILVNFGGKAAEGLDVEIIRDDSFIPCRSSGRLDAVETSTGKYPDLMNVFDEATQTLFSGKFFAAHTVEDSQDHDPSWDDLSEDWHHYFDCNFFTQSAQEGVRRIFQITADNADDGVGLDNPDVERLAPFHGPTVTSEAWKLMTKYEAWLERKIKTVTEGTAVVMYATAYSNTFKMAEALARGLGNAGISSELLNVEFTDAKEIKRKVEMSDGFAVGSPTLGGQMPIQIKEVLGIILKSAQGGSKQTTSLRKGSIGTKPCGAFGSFGWSGEAPEEVNARLKDGGFDVAFDPLRCKFTPTEEMIAQCEAAGAKLAQSINKAKKAQQQAMKEAEQAAGASKLEERAADSSKSAASESMLKAFGQIINSSCVLCFKAREEGAEAVRVPVSWVSQASFSPPGLMIAVEKKGLDAWMSISPKEQLEALFSKYDKDGSGELDREEIEPMLTEMLGVEVGSAQEEMLRAKKDEAWAVLDDDGSGVVDKAEFMAAATEGPFADIIARERRMASLESMMSSDSPYPVEFNLCMLPEGMTEAEATASKEHPKKKPKNGAPVIADCTAYVECVAKALNAAGTSTVVYAKVTAGDLVQEDKRTELLRADHVAIDHEAQDGAAAKQSLEVEVA